jgi:hypothetical protein
MDLRKTLIGVLLLLFTLSAMMGCSNEKAALSGWMQSLEEQQLSVYFWHNNIEKKLTAKEVQELISITSSLTEDSYKENKYLAGITPEYGLRLVIGDKEYHINQADAPNGETEINFQDRQWWIKSSDLHEYLLSLLNSSVPVRIEPTAAQWSPGQSAGFIMPVLDYASCDLIIFHGDFGLYVYDLHRKALLQSIDLVAIQCDAVQGDNACEINANADGSTVQLHTVNSDMMYVYTVAENSLARMAYQPLVNPFLNTVPIDQVISDERILSYSDRAVKFDTGEYGYLHTSEWTLGTLSFFLGETEYKLFNEENKQAK